jgi:hypothetical protein
VTDSFEWVEGKPRRDSVHILVTHEDAEETVAVVGPPVGRTFPVEFLPLHLPPAEVESIRADVRRELDFYLLEVGGADPWTYAIYHCGTQANVYSSVHWGCYDPRASEMG